MLGAIVFAELLRRRRKRRLIEAGREAEWMEMERNRIARGRRWNKWMLRMLWIGTALGVALIVLDFVLQP
jgi:hypothetical protein